MRGEETGGECSRKRNNETKQQRENAIKIEKQVTNREKEDLTKKYNGTLK